ncbi:MAG: hypothetical protein JW864_08605 [Spirochaetes bacterium]|nr:hypothetical protein [Spirochaetota bacterium]
MAFIEIPGFIGKVYVPDETKEKKKHNCKDCFSCQFCSDERCLACMKSHCGRNNCDIEDDLNNNDTGKSSE